MKQVIALPPENAAFYRRLADILAALPPAKQEIVIDCLETLAKAFLEFHEMEAEEGTTHE